MVPSFGGFRCVLETAVETRNSRNRSNYNLGNIPGRSNSSSVSAASAALTCCSNSSGATAKRTKRQQQQQCFSNVSRFSLQFNNSLK